MKKLIAALIAAMIVTPAHAADSCYGTATRNFLNYYHKGDRVMVTSFDGKNFSQHGGSIFPAANVKLVNCKIVRGNFSGGRHFDLVMDPNKNSGAALAYDQLDDQLLQVGLCSACASKVAAKYARGASSKFKTLVDRALNGDQRAIELLNNAE